MAPRTILYTGKGGVGKTSVAAATARRCAARGLRTVVLSTDPAHSLSDSLEMDLGSEPTACGDNLWGQEVQAQEEMERNWEAVQDWMGDLLAERGVDRISAEELTVPPGMDELFSLLQIKRRHEEGEYDVVIVDCAPDRRDAPAALVPGRRTLVARQGAAVRAPARSPPPARSRGRCSTSRCRATPCSTTCSASCATWSRMNEILRDRTATSIRLVMSPDRMVIREAMRTFTYLNLYGYLTDAVIVNRVFPEEVGDGYFAAWRAHQQEQMELVRSAFAPVPILSCPYFEREVIGASMLDRLAAETFGELEPDAVLHEELSQELVASNGSATLRLPIPFADKADIALKKIGLELIVRVGPGEADYHPSTRPRRLPAERRALRGGRPRGRFREER